MGVIAQLNVKTGKVLAKGIEASEDATEKVKDAAGNVAGTAKVKTDQTAEVGKQKANQVCRPPVFMAHRC